MDSELLVSADYLEENGFPTHSYLRREPSFITGSRAYGIPAWNADTDLVIYVSEADLKILQARFPNHKMMRHTCSFHIGDLNLICITNFDVYRKWRQGTDNLISNKPVTKPQAIAMFAGLFGEALSDEDIRQRIYDYGS